MNRIQLVQHACVAPGLRGLDFDLAESSFVAGIWKGKRMVGFSRASTDGAYRAVLWDVVVAGDLQGRGLGRQVVEALINHASVGNEGLLT